jgi:hypothetical protein
MLLAAVWTDHQAALRASLRAEYSGLTLAEARATMTPRELGELVMYLPNGCSLWQSVGGSKAWSDEVLALKELEHRLRIIAWQRTEDGQKQRNFPELQTPPPYAYEAKIEEQVTQRRAQKYLRRERARRDTEG